MKRISARSRPMSPQLFPKSKEVSGSATSTSRNSSPILLFGPKPAARRKYVIPEKYRKMIPKKKKKKKKKWPADIEKLLQENNANRKLSADERRRIREDEETRTKKVRKVSAKLRKAMYEEDHEVIQTLCTPEEGTPRTKNMKVKLMKDYVNHSPRQKTHLFTAVSKNDISMVNTLLSVGGIDINQGNTYGQSTPFRLACWNGSIEIVRLFLMREDVNVNAGGRRNMSPLYSAAFNGYYHIVKELLYHPKIQWKRDNPTKDCNSLAIREMLKYYDEHQMRSKMIGKTWDENRRRYPDMFKPFIRSYRKKYKKPKDVFNMKRYY